ncbi:unnamed protein product [Chrysoparadoxa australica]
MGFLSKLDLFSKLPKDLTESTAHGGFWSLCSAAMMLLLFNIEFFSYLSASTETSVVIDSGLDQHVRIHFNITMLDLPCEYATVTVWDVLGTNRYNVTQDIHKWHLDEAGVMRSYEGRNRAQKDIELFDQNHIDLAKLHENGVHAIPLDENTFETWLLEHPWTFVAFHAPWCVWCQRLMPTWEAFAEAVEDSKEVDVTVVSVDCVKNPDICKNFRVQAFPTMRMFRYRTTVNPDFRDHRTVPTLMEFAKSHQTIDKKPELKAEAVAADPNYLQYPGCLLTGSLVVGTVPGNFHVEAVSNSHNFYASNTNLSHVVNHMHWGQVMGRRVKRRVDELEEVHRQFSPMDGWSYITQAPHEAPHHYLKVVGTEYDLNFKRPFKAYQVLETNSMMNYGVNEVPEAKFTYDLSPMSVRVTRKAQRFYEFIVHVLAMVGGAVAVIGLADRLTNKVGDQRRRSSMQSVLSHTSQ